MMWQPKDKEDVVRAMLTIIGEDPKREGLKDTPARVVKMWNELFRGYRKDLLPKVTTFNNGSDGILYDQMIMDQGDFHATCEHHMVPFSGNFFFAYIPNKEGKILGLSKVARVVDYFSARLQTQERLVSDIVNYLWSSLCIDKTYKAPTAMGLVMEAEHLCKTMRGVKKKGKMRTTYLKGTLRTDPAARQEFLGWVNSNVR